MTDVVKEIVGRAESAPLKMDFLEWFWGGRKEDALNDTPVVLFGTGQFGKDLLYALVNHKIRPICFCNSDRAKAGTMYCNLPVISIDELKSWHQDSLIVIATHTHAASVIKLLLDMGFRRDRVIWPKNFDMLFGLYFSHANQSVLKFLRSRSNEELVHVLEENAEKLGLVYDLLTDRKSKDLLMAKLAFLMRSQNMELFRELMMDFSEPISEFGLIPFPDLGPENYFYFNNDVFSLAPDEVFVDVGAFDGDSVTAFVQACNKNLLAYERIYAFEPDPANYAALVKNTHAVKDISYHRVGVWSHSDLLRFQSSGKAFSTTASGIAEWGDIEIEVVSLDDLLGGKGVTLIKMDPPGSIIEKALKGAEHTISRYKPRLVLNAYDRLEDIFEVPYLLNSLWPDYKLYLRHVSWTISETDLFALAP